ncbi:MAG TPA: hypothetical protein ENJ28_06420 [Gammaproteobacteria bacterium]|nr:hypothetical protein [Gammaproteobacteria bacterium]
MIFYKETFSALAIILTFVAFFPYIRSVLKNKTKPHVFSWIIWGLTTFIVFLAQLEGGGGLGAWPIGLSGAITIYIAVLAYQKKSDISVTKTDWCFFLSALASIPVWIFSSDPLWTVIILTTVDLLGFGPTVRKAYSHPFDENMTVFIIFTCRNLAAIIALETYSPTTVTFPAAIALACAMLALMIAYRRRILSKLGCL